MTNENMKTDTADKGEISALSLKHEKFERKWGLVWFQIEMDAFEPNSFWSNEEGGGFSLGVQLCAGWLG